MFTGLAQCHYSKGARKSSFFVQVSKAFTVNLSINLYSITSIMSNILFRFLDVILGEQANTEQKIALRLAGNDPPPKMKKYAQLDSRLINLTRRFNEMDWEEYVESVAHNVMGIRKDKKRIPTKAVPDDQQNKRPRAHSQPSSTIACSSVSISSTQVQCKLLYFFHKFHNV